MSHPKDLFARLRIHSSIAVTSSDKQLFQAKLNALSSSYPTINLLSLILSSGWQFVKLHLLRNITMLNRMENREAARRWLELKELAV